MALNKEDPNPFLRAQVQAAMAAISPSAGGHLGDVQAVAEICLHILRVNAAEEIEANQDDVEWVEIMTDTSEDLRIAETFLEKAPYIGMHCDAA